MLVLQNVLWTAMMLGALIFIHESGHYMMAKLLGIRVEVFSLGFGPRLLGFMRGGTDYRVSLLPLGGYVKMLGETPDETLEGSREEFMSRSKRDRFLVLVMGATLNLVVAIVLITGLYMHGMPEALYEGQPAVIGTLDPNGAGTAAGLRLRDEIVAVGGVEVPTWRDMRFQIALNPGKTLDFKIRRDGSTETIPVQIRATERERMGIIGIGPWTRLALGKIETGAAADAAGLKAGDVLTSIEGREFFGGDGYRNFLELIESSASKPLAFVVDREGQSVTASVTPRDKDGKGYLGVEIGAPVGIRKYPLATAIPASLEYNWKQAGLLFATLKKLVTGNLSPRTLSGPLEIGVLTGEAARVGWLPFFQFMALVSLQLGVVNLLPIPVLDGGHIFILVIEGLMRRDFSMKLKERVLQFGFIVLLLIMGGVIFLDIDKMGFFKSLFGQ